MSLYNPLARAAAALGLAAALLWPAAASRAHHDDVPRLPPHETTAALPTGLRLDPNTVTVSGLSSGGFFAHQFHIAYSDLVQGAGIIAGGPFGCAERIPDPYYEWANVKLLRQWAATLSCTHTLGDLYLGLPVASPRVEDSRAVIAEARRNGLIADPTNLARHRVWLFHGDLDDLVPQAAADTLRDLYEALGVRGPRLEIKLNDPRNPAAHGMPVERFTGESFFPPRRCAEHEPPFIIECGFDAAKLLLRHLYGPDFDETPVDPHGAGRLMPFSQRPFIPPRLEEVSMSGVGYLYVPTVCRRQECRLHVAFHGCRQNVDTPPALGGVHDDFVRDAGYNRWAAANRIVVLYPQVTEAPLNPRRCWDFWAYSGEGYYGREAPQMRAVRAMIARLLGEH